MSGRIQVGDTVVCVDSIRDHDDSWPTSLIVGQEYKVHGVHDCGKFKSLSVGIPVPSGFNRFVFYCCGIPSCTDGTRYHWAWRFVKIDPLLLYNEAEEREKDKLTRYAYGYGKFPKVTYETDR